MNFNRCTLAGRLTRDPQLRKTSGLVDVVSFGLAVNRVWYTDKKEKREETLFIDCTAWQGRAAAIEKHCKQGDTLLVDGYLRTESWEDKDKQKRQKISFVVEGFQFGGKKQAGDANPSKESFANANDIPY